jgi:membrane protein
VFLVFLCRRGAVCLFGGEINGTVIAARRSRLQAKMLARRAEMEGKWTASST